ncbi:MAG TPA: cyclodeaminase/cyclohydrolase family protein [Methylomusa anaerophila]|uniref:Methenyltetrahydrofolate cyclohydrolase n=1 Tax=Methylomusa anaerophila TaxID=1930071 RepID=A0A348AGP7_9FIRM|nr:cyclodeaminase/cyclohydrolase family protein [Methylomusa anaerophila]BBB90245.1 methenyltetrahydrofolate cyclohydrolase [Methylomusa anaerophila]HML89408.1 cyclodeaminase/cyclohydrolase family protein [Methylomusa anaerophila]
MLSSLTIGEYAAKLASEEAPPGGGSTAALTGVLAVGLAEMAVNYSLQTAKLVKNREFLAAKQAALARLHRELSVLIDRDASALTALLAAVDLAADTPAARQSQDAAIQRFLRQAAEVPLNTAHACLEAIKISKAVMDQMDEMVISDLMAGVLMGHAGVMSALLSTAINLNELEDEALVGSLKTQIHDIRRAADELKNTMEKQVYSRQTFTVMGEE